MSAGEVLRVRAAMKPISTVPRALATVDVATGEAAVAINQRSDVCAVPAAGVVAEAMVALVLAEAVLEKFGGDSVGETSRNVASYLARLAERDLTSGCSYLSSSFMVAAVIASAKRSSVESPERFAAGRTATHWIRGVAAARFRLAEATNVSETVSSAAAAIIARRLRRSTTTGLDEAVAVETEPSVCSTP